MIPVTHGTPNLKLSPLARLWQCRNGIGFTGSFGEGVRLELYPKTDALWKFQIATDHGRALLTILDEQKDETGRTYLSGRLGLTNLVVKANGFDKGPALTVYASVLRPKGV